MARLLALLSVVVLALLGIGPAGAEPAPKDRKPTPANQPGEVVASLALSADGRMLAAGEADGPIRLRHAATGQALGQLTGHTRAVQSLCFSLDGKLLASGGRDWTIRLWDVAGGKERQRLDGHADVVAGVAFSSDGRTLASFGQRDATIFLWDVARGKRLRRLDEASYVQAVTFSPDGKVLTSVNEEGTVRLWDVATGKPLRKFEVPPLGVVACMALTPDGHVLALASWGGELGLWEVASGRVLGWLRGHQGRVHSLAFASSGRTLLSGDAQTVRLWEVATCQELCPFWVAEQEITCMALSADGRVLGAGAGRPRIWDLKDRFPDTEIAARELRPGDLSRLWAELGEEDALLAYRAASTLAAAPDRALPLLREHLVPIQPAGEVRIGRLIADLDHDEFLVRNAASRELRELGNGAVPALRQALASRPSLEARRRIEALLADREDSQPRLTPGQLRQVRALGLLEQLGSKEARQMLEALAAGAPDAWLTKEARETLDRLNRRSTALP